MGEAELEEEISDLLTELDSESMRADALEKRLEAIRDLVKANSSIGNPVTVVLQLSDLEGLI